MDDEHDEISEWAKDLTPEGSPGTMPAYMRGVLGDKRYEEELELQAKVRTLTLERGELVNNVIRVASALLSLYGFLGLVLLVAVNIKFIF